MVPEVLEAMMPYLTSEWVNPSSSYKFGSKLKTVIETARSQVADCHLPPSISANTSLATRIASRAAGMPQ